MLGNLRNLAKEAFVNERLYACFTLEELKRALSEPAFFLMLKLVTVAVRTKSLHHYKIRLRRPAQLCMGERTYCVCTLLEELECAGLVSIARGEDDWRVRIHNLDRLRKIANAFSQTNKCQDLGN